MNTKLVIAGVVAVGGAVAVASVVRHHTSARPEVAAVQPEAPAPSVEIPRTDSEPVVEAPVTPPAVTVADRPAVPKPTMTPAAVVKAPVIAPRPSAPNAKPVAADAPPPHPAVPFGRAALSFVGMDEEAELVWGLTINDPTVPPEARKDLIEDLNEDGFVDPKHLTPSDVPLIMNRMDLIERMAPDSMDEVNAAAFLEAYKDLTNMLAKAGR